MLYLAPAHQDSEVARVLTDCGENSLSDSYREAQNSGGRTGYNAHTPHNLCL